MKIIIANVEIRPDRQTTTCDAGMYEIRGTTKTLYLYQTWKLESQIIKITDKRREFVCMFVNDL